MTIERKHALLSASGAHRWMECTASPKLEAMFPDETSSAAAEGTLAHEIAELKLRKTYLDTTISTRKFNTEMNKLKEHPLYNDEMQGFTDEYADYVAKVVHAYTTPPYVTVERRLDFSDIVPDGFGTGDCIVIGGNVLHIIDLKYGIGVPVTAEENPQLMLYGLGALHAYSLLYDIQTVKLAIVQPRRNSISEWEISTADLREWGENTVKPIAALAYGDNGTYQAGEHCRFCRAKSSCRARAQFNLSLTRYECKTPPLLSNDEIGEILESVKDLESWAKDLKAYALSELLPGQMIQGWKAVEGRSTREFKDTDAAFAHIASSGIDETMLYERVPLTLTKTEKLLGKKKFDELLFEFVARKPGCPTLVPETDKREPLALPTAIDDFSDMIKQAI